MGQRHSERHQSGREKKLHLLEMKMQKWYRPRERDTQERCRRRISEPYGKECDAARQDRLEPQQKHAEEELSRDSVMQGALGFIDERGVLRPEKCLCAIGPYGDEPGDRGPEQSVKLRAI
jgi:hypothetical protein